MKIKVLNGYRVMTGHTFIQEPERGSSWVPADGSQGVYKIIKVEDRTKGNYLIHYIDPDGNDYQRMFWDFQVRFCKVVERHPDDIFVWPDGAWFYRSEVDEGYANHRSDDYRVVSPMSDEWEQMVEE